MSHSIYFSGDGETVYCPHEDFSVSSFSTETSAYGNLRRISITLEDHVTGQSYPLVSTSYEVMTRKLNSKMESLIKEHLKTSGKTEAERKTESARNYQEFLANPLKKLIPQIEELSIERFLRKEDYDGSPPSKPSNVLFRSKPSKPNKEKYRAKINFIDVLLQRKSQKLISARALYRKALKDHLESLNKHGKEYAEHLKAEEKRQKKFNEELKWFEAKKAEFLKHQQEENEKILALEKLTSDSSQEKIEEYFQLFIGGLKIDELLTVLPEAYYENQTLIVNIELPANEVLPKLKNVSYIQSRNEYKETYISKAQETENYNNLIFSLCLFYMKLAVEKDINNILENIAINGFVEARNKANGKLERKCILSVMTDTKSISEIDFDFVEPKSCFKTLKGLHATNLLDEIAVKPVIQTSRADNRFIEAEDNLENLDSESNLAAMDWQEFEHLVREVFEKEFSNEGGEVKVTQSSRDGGVDAIAFDPDPIKGGKIVIQAKRYTNVVGVASVRDLYGTVINEGANRGVLITTSDFGPDSHNFVKDKPITLLNGKNLLFLLSKHGYHAKIDIKEAKRILKHNSK